MRTALCLLAFVAFALVGACSGPAPRPVDSGVVMMTDAFSPPRDTGVMCVMGMENTVALCSDGCDNDGNMFVDCADFGCCAFRTDCPMGTACGDRPDAGMATTLTIAQLQNRADPAHPMAPARVTVTQAGMVALTPRMLIGSATGGTSMTCRFAVWVGAAVSGDFTAIEVQESIPLPAGTASCFALPVGRISDMFAPGDAVTAITNATYNEFCAAPSGTMPVPCTDFEQSEIFLGGMATITRGAAGTAPAGTVATIASLVGAAGAPGPRAIALEAGLLRVAGVRIGSRMDGTFLQYFAMLPGAPTIDLDLVVSNFPQATCARAALTTLAAGTTTVASIDGILLPNFGRWSLRVRDENDIAGITCP